MKKLIVLSALFVFVLSPKVFATIDEKVCELAEGETSCMCTVEKNPQACVAKGPREVCIKTDANKKCIETELRCPNGNYGCPVGNYKNVTYYSRGGWMGFAWEDSPYPFQCVAFAQRFYKTVIGRTLPPPGAAENFYKCYDYADLPETTDKEKKFKQAMKEDYEDLVTEGIIRISNNGTTLPKHGDALVWSGGGYGHVAIVKYVTETKVVVIEQNWSKNFIRELTIIKNANGTYKVEQTGKNYAVLGWLRYPGYNGSDENVKDYTPPFTPYENIIGYTAKGQKVSFFKVFYDMYNGKDNVFNQPTDYGGGKYVHMWPTPPAGCNVSFPNICYTDALWVQDFKNAQNVHWMFIYNKEKSIVYAANGRILDFYLTYGGYAKYGPPISNEYLQFHLLKLHKVVVQEFKKNGKVYYVGFDPQDPQTNPEEYWGINLLGEKEGSFGGSAGGGLYPPTNFTATTISSSQIHLSWDEEENLLGEGTIEYIIYRNDIAIAKTSATNYIDSGLSANAFYCYKITAYLSGYGESEPTVAMCPTTPPLPPPVLLGPKNFRVKQMMSTYYPVLGWDAVSTTVSFVDRYVLDRKDQNGQIENVCSNNMTTECTDYYADNYNGQTLVYSVYAIYENGTQTPKSELSVIIPAPIQPVPIFSASPIEGTAPLTVQFTNQSTGDIWSQYWEFGDGSTSGQQSPSHVYTKPGQYIAKLTVAEQATGRNFSASQLITVIAPDTDKDGVPDDILNRI